MLNCQECGRDFSNWRLLGLHIAKCHFSVEEYFRKHMMFANEDKCIHCGASLKFYGLTYRFRSGQCFNCSQSNNASQCNKNGKNSEHRRKLNKARWSILENREKQGQRMTNLWKDSSFRGKQNRRSRPWSGITGYFKSSKIGYVLYRSSWELAAYELLDRDDLVKKYIAEPFAIEYTHNDKTANYYPDLLVEYTDGRLELIEIKPKGLIQDPVVRSKFKAACAYCKLHEIRFKVWHEFNKLSAKTSKPSFQLEEDPIIWTI
jgi:hypothetical protein